MVGQVDPWRSYDDGSKIYTLLTSVEVAMEECSAWSNQEFTRQAFIAYLRDNGVIVFKNVEEFVKLKEEPIMFKKGYKKKITEERREELRNKMVLMNEKKKASVS